MMRVREKGDTVEWGRHAAVSEHHLPSGQNTLSKLPRCVLLSVRAEMSYHRRTPHSNQSQSQPLMPLFPPPQAFLSAETHEDSPVSSLYGIPLISNNSDSPHSTVFMYENNTAPDVQRDNTDTAKAAQLPHNFSLRRTQLWRQCRFHCCVYLPSA